MLSKKLMPHSLRRHLQRTIEEIKTRGLYQEERVILSAQEVTCKIGKDKKVLNFCTNNYLGLATHPRVIEAALRTLRTHGYGLASVRFICGTQNIHKELEAQLSAFLGTEDTILYASAFDANGGLFEPFFDEKDVIFSDTLNHASIIDGIRLCKAQRIRYVHNDMNSLEDALKKEKNARYKVIVTDGVFSMDGTIAQLDTICALAKKYDALTVIDECHATGFLGKDGRGTHEYRNVLGQVDIITGTFGKALGGANGGFTSGNKEVIQLLRQKSRPYLFSNSVAPSIVGATMEALKIVAEEPHLRTLLMDNTTYFRNKVQKLGYKILKGHHPIVPIMLYESVMAQKLSAKLLERGIYVIPFSYPVVPSGKARIRIQLSAAHTKEHIEALLLSLEKEGIALGLI